MASGGTLKIYVFYCATSFDATELLRGCGDMARDLKMVPLPCSGKIDILYLTKAFETGADAAAIVTCEVGECRYLEGNLRARKRAGAVEALLEEARLGKGRMVVIHMAEGQMARVVRDVRDFHGWIAALPRQALQARTSAAIS